MKRSSVNPPLEAIGPRAGRRRLVGQMLTWAAGLGGAGAMLSARARTVFGQSAPAAPGSPAGRPAAGNVASTGRLRRWAMVIDLRRCDGCQSINKPPQCTQACIQAHLVPEPMQWMEVYEGPLANGGTQFIPTPCQQCQNPPCANVCPVGATFSTPEGVVLIDQDRCIGCRICLEACPYDRRFFNWGEPPQPTEAQLMAYNPEHQTPARRGTAMKCDFCPDLARAGRLPYCAQGCPKNAIYYGDLEEDIATNGTDVIQFSQFVGNNNGYRLKEDLGTQPRVYYIPGSGQAAGRNPFVKGHKPIVWPWTQKTKGAVTWTR